MCLLSFVTSPQITSHEGFSGFALWVKPCQYMVLRSVGMLKTMSIHGFSIIFTLLSFVKYLVFQIKLACLKTKRHDYIPNAMPFYGNK